ncbi:hypothetical protein CAPTEDRAFT_158133 [Capitella teleta]|uniref:MYND-type domain-containing protein n=1 Tax=Capitella teleta TaxID=283909 RepID=R7UVM6_CAPTE|nr:hypothetical protein CAPTEDRAFT_158133 [Capitella teleta]|eukprot:ELU10312.1 hypothetical protein CAPTEDRAFT_158133 [Capitella teleta]
MKLKRGETWVKEDPFVHVLSQTERDSRCDFCFRRPENDIQIPRCSSCKVVRFCNRKCQSSAWSVHKKECRSLKRVAPKIPTDSVRLIFRLLIKLESDIEDVEVFGKKRNWADLISHVDEVQEDQIRLQQFMVLMTTLKSFSENVMSMPSVEELFVIFGRVCVNSFSICDPEMNPIGVGVYIRQIKPCSVLDHSCRPNAVAVFEGTTLRIRCVEPVDSEQDLRISYIDTLDDTTTRRRNLQQQYYFNCLCGECKDSEKDLIKFSFNCTSVECKGHVTQVPADDRFSCDICGTTVDDVNLNQAAEKAQKIIKHLNELKKQREHESIRMKGLSCVSEMRAILHPYNVHFIKLCDLSLDACIETSQWDDALELGRLTVVAYRFYYGELHPSVGILLFKIGKILSYLADREALQFLKQAATVLRVTHGDDHSLYKDLAQLIDQNSN